MPPEQTARLIGIVFGGFFVGAVCGILPLVLALRKQRRGLAMGSWFGCVVSGLILGLILAIPVSAILSVIIVCLRKPEPPSPQAQDPGTGLNRTAGSQ